jgi:hypothetical protein
MPYTKMLGGDALVHSGGKGQGEKEDRCPNFHGWKNQKCLRNGKIEEKKVSHETSLDDGLN